MLPDLPIRHPSAPGDVLADLSRGGLALLDAVPGPRQLIDLAHALGTVVLSHRDSGPDGVTTIQDQAMTTPGLLGFSCAALPPHTDRSGQAEPPDLLLTICGQEPTSGGETLLIDGRAVYLDLARNSPNALAALTTPRSALFGDADGHLGSVFATQPNGIITVRLRLDALARFGPNAAPHIPALRATIDRHTSTLPARAGTGYILDNRRWLHGRHSYTGPRVMYRITATADPGSIMAGFAAAELDTVTARAPVTLGRRS